MTALFSSCRTWRYALDRDLGGLFGRGRVAWVLLNPSTADEVTDDPTVRRCIGFTRSWGYARLTILNSYAFRSTDPNGLLTVEDPIGPDNDVHLIRQTKDAELIVCAWGTHVNDAVQTREDDIVGMLRAAGRGLSCLRTTKGGHPEHPLYLPGDLKPVFFRPVTATGVVQ